MQIRSKFLLFIFTLIATCDFNVVCAQALSFSPTRIFFKGNPGETVTENVTVVNSGTDVYEFVTRLQDWKRDSLGTKVYFPMGTLPNSNGKTISLSSTNFSLAAGEKKSFTISMRIPESQNNSVSTNSMLFFTQANPKESGKSDAMGIGIRLSIELGVQLFYTPAEARPGEMKFLAFEYDTTINEQYKTGRLAVKFENTGDLNKDGFVRFELTNKQTGEEIKLQPIPIAIMPHNYQWVYGALTAGLSTGDYLAVAILDTGGNNDLKVAEKDIHVKK